MGEIKKKLSSFSGSLFSSHSSCQLALVAPPPKQPQTSTSNPARRPVYRLSRDSRYLVIHSRRFKLSTSGLHQAIVSSTNVGGLIVPPYLLVIGYGWWVFHQPCSPH